MLTAADRAFETGDYAAATDAYARAAETAAGTPLFHFRYGYSLHVTGHPAEALPHHLRAIEIDHPALRIDALYNAACAYSLLGDRARAIEYLSLAIDAGFKDSAQLAKDTDLDSLRNDAEFRRLAARVATAANTPAPSP